MNVNVEVIGVNQESENSEKVRIYPETFEKFIEKVEENRALFIGLIYALLDKYYNEEVIATLLDGIAKKIDLKAKTLWNGYDGSFLSNRERMNINLNNIGQNKIANEIIELIFNFNRISIIQKEFLEICQPSKENGVRNIVYNLLQLIAGIQSLLENDHKIVQKNVRLKEAEINMLKPIFLDLGEGGLKGFFNNLRELLVNLSERSEDSLIRKIKKDLSQSIRLGTGHPFILVKNVPKEYIQLLSKKEQVQLSTFLSDDTLYYRLVDDSIAKKSTQVPEGIIVQILSIYLEALDRSLFVDSWISLRGRELLGTLDMITRDKRHKFLQKIINTSRNEAEERWDEENPWNKFLGIEPKSEKPIEQEEHTFTLPEEVVTNETIQEEIKILNEDELGQLESSVVVDLVEGWIPAKLTGPQSFLFNNLPENKKKLLKNWISRMKQVVNLKEFKRVIHELTTNKSESNVKFESGAITLEQRVYQNAIKLNVNRGARVMFYFENDKVTILALTASQYHVGRK